jgi:hypothetical protein
LITNLVHLAVTVTPRRRWRRLPALNTNRAFIDDLADAVLEALPFAGSMAGSNPSDSLVPLGALQAASPVLCLL